MHSSYTNMKDGWAVTLLAVRAAKPGQTRGDLRGSVVSICPCGNCDRSLVARRVLMTQNTLFGPTCYRAERILAVRTAIRASRGAVRARLESSQ
jgi:hypothetical protein